MGLGSLFLVVPFGFAVYWAYRQVRFLLFGQEYEAVVVKQWTEGSGEGSTSMNELEVLIPGERSRFYEVRRIATSDLGDRLLVVLDDEADRIAVRQRGKPQTVAYLIMALMFAGWIAFGSIFVLIRS